MTVEELQVLITANTEMLRKELKSSQKQLVNMQKVANQTSSKMLKSFNFLKNGIIALAIGKIIGAQMDEAVDRLDALNNFPRVMSNLGIGAEEAEASMKRLSDALIGLPTTLDDATLSVQRFTSANGNVKASTEMFLALNNAILAGGASTQVQSTALEQLSQAYAKGKPDMMEWRSAMTAMPAQLKQVAIAMGYASSAQLGEALRDGTVSMNEFMVKITELNKNGLNGFKSFEEQARNSTGGVKTSMINVKTAITRGLAQIMDAIGQSNIAGFFNGIASAINKVIPYITGFVKACVWAVSSISGLFGKSNKKNIDNTSKSLANLGVSGASTATDLDNTNSSAKKLSKTLNGLAAFDEMNVLKEADNSSSDDDGATALGDLGDIDLSGFNDLNNTLNDTDKIANKLKKIFGDVGKTMQKAWDSKPVQAFVYYIQTKFGFIKDLSKKLGEDLFDNMSTTWSNIEDNVDTSLDNISTLFTDMWTDIGDGIETWGQPIIDGVSGVFNSIWQDYIEPITKNISKVWADFSGILVDLWNEHGKKLVNNIGEFVTTVIGLFKKIWDKIITPIIEPFLETLSWLWDKHIKDLVKNIGEFVMKLVNFALEIYNKFIAPLISAVVDKLSPVWAFLSNIVISSLGTIFAAISDVFSSIFKILGGVIDFISGVFAGDWKKAWNGIKDIFSGIVSGLGAIFKKPMNSIIDGINSFISGVNKIEIPDWVPAVGGRSFHISKISKLARGGVVDRPTYAMIGEAGKEAVVPLERNTGWIDTLAEKINTNGNGQPIHVTVKLGEDTLIDKVIDDIKEKNFETNGEVVFSL